MPTLNQGPLYLLRPEMARRTEATYESLKFNLKFGADTGIEAPQKTLYIFTDHTVQDILKWTQEVRIIAGRNNWSAETTQDILNILVAERYHVHFKDKQTFDTKLDALSDALFPTHDYKVCRNILKNAKRNSFTSIEQFIEFLENLRQRINLCGKSKKNALPERDILDKLISSLDNREKTFLIAANAQTIEEIKTELNKLTTMKSLYQLNPINNQPFVKDEPKQIVTEKYCSFHKSKYHDTSECRKEPLKQKKTFPNPQGQTSKSPSRTYVITNQELRSTTTKAIECKVKLLGETFDFLVDTGADDSFISEELTKKLGCELMPTTKAIELADGSEANIKHQLSTSFAVKGTPINFEETFYVLPALPRNGVLGLKFLQKYGGQISCRDSSLTFENSPENTPETESNKNSYVYINSKPLTDIINTYQKTNPVLGHIKTYEMTLPLKDNIPVHLKPYPIELARIPAVKAEIEKLLQLGIIRKSISPYASPAFPRPKKNGKIRLVVDYRILNEKTIKLGYPFPNIQYTLMDLKGSKAVVPNLFRFAPHFRDFEIENAPLPLQKKEIAPLTHANI
jgi:hypothetical protein